MAVEHPSLFERPHSARAPLSHRPHRLVGGGSTRVCRLACCDWLASVRTDPDAHTDRRLIQRTPLAAGSTHARTHTVSPPAWRSCYWWMACWRWWGSLNSWPARTDTRKCVRRLLVEAKLKAHPLRRILRLNCSCPTLSRTEDFHQPPSSSEHARTHAHTSALKTTRLDGLEERRVIFLYSCDETGRADVSGDNLPSRAYRGMY